MKTGSAGIESELSVFSQLTLQSRKLVTNWKQLMAMVFSGYDGGLAQSWGGGGYKRAQNQLVLELREKVKGGDKDHNEGNCN